MMERGLADLIRDPRVRVALEKAEHEVHPPGGGCHVEWGEPTWVGFIVGVGFGFQEHGEPNALPVHDGVVEASKASAVSRLRISPLSNEANRFGDPLGAAIVVVIQWAIA